MIREYYLAYGLRYAMRVTSGSSRGRHSHSVRHGTWVHTHCINAHCRARWGLRYKMKIRFTANSRSISVEFGIKPYGNNPQYFKYDVSLVIKNNETYFSLAWLSEGTVDPFPLGNMLGTDKLSRTCQLIKAVSDPVVIVTTPWPVQ